MTFPSLSALSRHSKSHQVASADSQFTPEDIHPDELSLLPKDVLKALCNEEVMADQELLDVSSLSPLCHCVTVSYGVVMYWYILMYMVLIAA